MKSVLITGSGTGLGRELAFLYADAGYHIILTGRTLENLHEVKTQIEANQGQADVLTLDITDSEQVQMKMREILTKYKLYGLINNAGVGHFGPFEEMTENEINEMLHTNVLGTILMTKAAITQLKDEGFVMNIISTAGLRGKVHEAGYVASKFAVRGFTESLQKEYADFNIKINAVYMGGMDTPFWDQSHHVKDKSRLKSPKDVAAFIFERKHEDTIMVE